MLLTPVTPLKIIDPTPCLPCRLSRLGEEIGWARQSQVVDNMLLRLSLQEKDASVEMRLRMATDWEHQLTVLFEWARVMDCLGLESDFAVGLTLREVYVLAWSRTVAQ